jgi:protein-S-isoprenylcysteine O-methyltransferase Ste14
MSTLRTHWPHWLSWERIEPFYPAIYRTVGYLGLVSVFGSQLWGFRYSPTAPPSNYLYDLLLYAIFLVPHLVMSRSWFKRLAWGDPAGSAPERRLYILTSVVTWWAVWFGHYPLPGPALSLPGWDVIGFFGMLAFLLCLMLFFQGIHFQMIDGLLGVPGAQGSYTHGAETPLLTDGPYARVRHPMYRAALLASLASIVIHPNAAQVFWSLLIPLTFIAYIPIEETQLRAARGDEYRLYCERTPYRLWHGIW